MKLYFEGMRVIFTGDNNNEKLRVYIVNAKLFKFMHFCVIN